MPNLYRIWPSFDRALDANVELDGSAVVLHSRGGATGGRPPRNTEYEEALSLIVDRLTRQSQWIDRVLIDSAKAIREFPNPEDRVLMTRAEVEQIADPVEITRAIRRRLQQFGQAAGTTGGNSTKQVRIETKWLHSALRAGLSLRIVRSLARPTRFDGSRLHRRLSAAEQNAVEPDHIHAAVDSLIAGVDAPNFAQSRDYDVVTPAGERLAPKKVFALALEAAGVISGAMPDHFSAGWSQPSFRIIQSAGYPIVAKDAAEFEARRQKAKGEADQAEVERAAQTVPVDAEERSWIEGDKRMAKHLRIERRRSTNAANAKRAQVRALNDGRLACEHCDTDWYVEYPHGIAEAIFDVHHTKPLKDMDEGHETKVEDLLCLCANCHRAEHRRLALGPSVS